MLIPPIAESPVPDYAKYHEQIETAIKAYQSGNKAEAYKQISFNGENLEKRYGRFLEI